MKLLVISFLLLGAFVGFELNARIMNQFENAIADYDKGGKKYKDILRQSTKYFHKIAINTILSDEKKNEMAEYMLAQLKYRQIPINVITYNVAMSVFASTENSERVLDLFFEMQGSGIEPDTISYAHAISQYLKDEYYDPVEASKLVDRANRWGLLRAYPVNGVLDLSVEATHPEGLPILPTYRNKYPFLVTAILLNGHWNYRFGLSGINIKMPDDRSLQASVFEFLEENGYSWWTSANQNTVYIPNIEPSYGYY